MALLRYPPKGAAMKKETITRPPVRETEIFTGWIVADEIDKIQTDCS